MGGRVLLEKPTEKTRACAPHISLHLHAMTVSQPMRERHHTLIVRLSHSPPTLFLACSHNLIHT